MNAIRKLTITVVILILALGIPGSAAAQLNVTGPSPLTLPQDYNNPVFGAFNEVRQGVGFARFTDGYDYIILWDSVGTPKILGEGWALGINNLGQVVGMHGNQVAYWQPGVEQPLIIQTPNTGGISGGVSINESGVFAGCYGLDFLWNYSDISGAFIYDTTTSEFTDLRPYLGDSCAYDINDQGQVVGSSEYGMFVFTPGATPEIKYLTSGPDTGMATAINDMGWVTGYAYDGNGHQHAFLWKPEVAGLTFLGEDTIQGKGINNYGMITGDLSIEIPSGSGNWVTKGFIWSDGVLQQLPSGTGSTRTEVWRISNRVEGPLNVAFIAGTDTTPDGTLPVFWRVTLPFVTPQDHISYIQTQTTTLVTSGTLSKGEGKALSSKLDPAANQLAKGKTKPAINLLEAFIYQTEALVRSGRLTQAEGQSLIIPANNAIEAIQTIP
jgi:probable HAF family extracellular repeat protein